MTPRVVVATPVYGGPVIGSVSVGYLSALLAVTRMIQLSFIPHVQLTNCDLVRGRSRAVRVALDACATHLLFWDADVVGDAARCLAGMLGADVDFIAAPYPRKVNPTSPTHHPPHVAMGFTLVKVTALERMWDAYYDELQFDDVVEGKPYRTVALFQLMMNERPAPRPHRVLLSEDFSFSQRWLDLGGDIHVCDQPGIVMAHVGSTVYGGTSDELRRTQ